LSSQVTGWTLATQARLGLTGEARAGLAALADETAGAGEIRNARAVICLADGDPAGPWARYGKCWTARRR
jgi:LuxR family maltose regulon positive regulatory protein